jgi:hypothetical protein
MMRPIGFKKQAPALFACTPCLRQGIGASEEASDGLFFEKMKERALKEKEKI